MKQFVFRKTQIKFEKIYIPVLCDRVYNLLCKLMESTIELSSKADCNINQVFTVVYTVQLLSAMSSRFQKGFCLISS